jgi:hypothetical protein
MRDALPGRRIFALGAIAFATTAATPLATPDPLPALAGRVIQVGCRQGECAWLRIVRLEAAAANSRGELRRLVGRAGTSLYDNGDPPRAFGTAVRVQWEARDHEEYAFCSTERPGHAFPDGQGSYLLHYLDLFSPAGYQLGSATIYMRICHDLNFVEGDTAPLRRLGYRPGTRSEQIEDAAPEDLAR